MAAPKGNKFWMARYTHGRKPKISTPAKLREAAIEYFEYLEENPLISYEVVKHQGEAFNHPVPTMPAPTLQGLWVWLGISHTTWQNWKDREGFLAVIEEIDRILYDWKFRGAAAGLLNANIIARDLGLRDKADITSDGESIGPITTITQYYHPGKE